MARIRRIGRARARLLGREASPVLVVLLLSLLLGACGHASAPAPPPEADGLARPPFVRVDTETGPTLFVLGTVHLGPAEGWRFSPEIEHVLAEADTLVLEIDVGGLDPDAVANATAERVILQGGKRLPDVLTPETNAVLRARDAELAAAGLTERARSLYEPWFLAVGLVELIAQRSDFDLAASAESAVMARFGGDETLALETFVEQLDMLDQLPLALQDLLLRDALSRLGQADEDLIALVDAWRTGDRPSLVEQSRAGVDELPELERVYTVLLDDRNLRWIEQLDALARDPARRDQTVVVAVGALHVVGDVGVPALLQKAGYTVTRIH